VNVVCVCVCVYVCVFMCVCVCVCVSVCVRVCSTPAPSACLGVQMRAWNFKTCLGIKPQAREAPGK